jgi:aryl-alcohol dehydrogenase-like predicted oxidoreductase
VLRHPAVTSAVAGVSSVEQLEDVVRTTDSPILTLNDLDLMKKAIPVINYREHRK